MRLTAERRKKISVPGDEDGGFIVIANLSMEEKARIDSKFVILQGDEVQVCDFVARDEAYARATLRDWGNFFDEENNPLRFNAKGITKAGNYSIDIEGEDRMRFFAWVVEEMEAFAAEVEEEEKDAVKN